MARVSLSLCLIAWLTSPFVTIFRLTFISVKMTLSHQTSPPLPPNTLQMILVDMDFLFKFWLDFSCCFSSEYEYTFISNLDIVIVLEIVCFRLEEENGSWCFWCMCVCVFVHSTFHPLATFIAGSLIDFHFIHPFIHSFASIFVVHFTIHVPMPDIREFWLPVTVNLKLICNGNYLSYNLIMAHRRTTFAEEKNFLIGQQT